MLTEKQISELQEEVRHLSPKAQRDVYEMLQRAEQTKVIPPTSQHFAPEVLNPKSSPSNQTPAQEYAQTLIEHFNSIGKADPDLNLRQIFSGARKAIPNWIDPEEKKIVIEGYSLAEKALFPQQSPQ